VTLARLRAVLARYRRSAVAIAALAATAVAVAAVAVVSGGGDVTSAPPARAPATSSPFSTSIAGSVAEPPETTAPPASTPRAPGRSSDAPFVHLRPGNVIVESLGARTPVERSLARSVVDEVAAFVRAATIHPLRTGEPSPRLAARFAPGAFPPAGPRRGAVSDEQLPRAGQLDRFDAEPVTITVLQDGGGNTMRVAATIDYRVTGRLQGRPLAVHRAGDLYYERDDGGRWRIVAYDLAVDRRMGPAGRAPADRAGGDPGGYWLVSADGTVWARVGARFLGSASGAALAARVSDAASTPSGEGYWLVGGDGGVFAFGDAGFEGSAAGRSAAPVVAIAATATGRGYWLATRDGAVLAFGDARHRGGLGSEPLAAPIVDMAATPSGRGYWLASADGGVFAFGDARFRGSLAGEPLQGRIVAIAATPSGRGYWLAAADGGVFTFGDAEFRGPRAGGRPAGPVVGFAATPSGRGYWLATAGGAVHAFGDARRAGTAGAGVRAPLDPIVAIAPA
jgi:hypothetical protein